MLPATVYEDTAIISVHQLTRRYHEGGEVRTVLDAVNANVAAGECVALLGRSGSGKSTLLNLVGGIDLPDQGEITVAGQRLDNLSERARTLFRRSHIGIVYQFFNLIPNLTVWENVCLPVELGDGDRAAGRDRAAALLESVGLAERRNSFPDRLSGGEQQRVAIARALAHDPALILADEPTGNLDAQTGALIIDLLGDLVRRHGKTLLVVTHGPEVAAMADRVLELENGQLHEAAQ